MELKRNSLLQGGRYKIIETLGQGGFGRTYLAEQVLMNRRVCIKEFCPMISSINPSDATAIISISPDNLDFQLLLERFIKEAQIIAELTHPNIVTIHDIFKEGDSAFYVMEYLEGGTITDLVRQSGPLPEDKAIDYILQIAEALNFAHHKKIMHLDVKPDNIMLDNKGNAVLVDFGLAKHYDKQGTASTLLTSGLTEGYAPIEQYSNKGIMGFSPQIDVYSLGATMFHMLTGSVPPTPLEIMNDGLPALPDSVTEKTRSAVIAAMQILSKDRPATMGRFITLLKSAPSSQKANVKKSLGKKEAETSPSDKSESRVTVKEKKVASVKTKSDNIVEPQSKSDTPKRLTDKELLQLYQQCRFTSLIPQLERSIKDEENTFAMYLLALCYFQGNGVSFDMTKVKQLLKCAAEKCPEAQYMLGNLHFWGSGVRKNYSSAFELYSKAANSGYWKAQERLSICYLMGKGVTKDLVQSRKWRDTYLESLQKASKEGDSDASCTLFYLYSLGFCNFCDRKKAFQIAKKAADMGSVRAMALLFNCFAFGDGTDRDVKLAFSYASAVLERGCCEGNYMMGQSYANGIGCAVDSEKAASYYKKYYDYLVENLNNGNKSCSYSYACLNLWGMGCDSDLNKAISALEDYFQAGFIDGHALLPLLYLDKQEYTKAINHFTIGAEAGYMEPVYYLGQMSIEGSGMPRSVKNGLEQITQMASLNLPIANACLGDFYYSGSHVRANKQKAFSYYQLAADAGDFDALAKLGRMYLAGEGVSRNVKQAVAAFTTAADHLIPEGMTQLGICYESGLGVQKSFKKASDWFEKAIHYGSVAANYHLGMLYNDHGTDLKKDLTQVYELIKKAADADYGPALLSLGKSFRNGLFTVKDLNQSLLYFKRAARLQVPEGYFELGVIYEYGLGVRKSKDLALENYQLAAQYGKPYPLADEKVKNLSKSKKKFFGLF